MNRLLLQECLEELHSDDSVELTEGRRERRKRRNHGVPNRLSIQEIKLNVNRSFTRLRQRNIRIKPIVFVFNDFITKSVPFPRMGNGCKLHFSMGTRQFGALKIASRHLIDGGCAHTGGFTIEELNRDFDSILNGGEVSKETSHSNNDCTIIWTNAHQNLTWKLVVFKRSRVDWEINAIYTDRDQKTTKRMSDAFFGGEEKSSGAFSANRPTTGKSTSGSTERGVSIKTDHENQGKSGGEQPPATPPTGPGVQESFFSRFSNLDYLYQILDEGKDRLIDRLPSLDDAQKTQMKQFFAKRPNLESKFDWNRPDSITWDAFQNIASGYEEPIDPDTVPEFSDKRDEGDGIFSYQVQDDKNGQLAVRRIIDTHWGKDANPWCLTSRGEYQWETTPEYREWLQTQDLGWRGLEYLAAHGTLDEDDDRMFKGKYKRETGKSAEVHDDGLSTARRLWLHYSSLPKRIAFRNGKLLAFMATEDAKKFGELWWDRNNKDHPSVHDCVISTPRTESAL